MSRSLNFLIIFIICAGCADLNIGRSYLSEMNHDDSRFFSPREDFSVVGGDSGEDYISNRERMARTPGAKDDEVTRTLKRELRELESMETEENLEFYSRYKMALGSTSSKIYFLKIPPHERKDYLMSRGIIDAPSRGPASTVHERMMAAQHRDIILGMSKNEVMSSWGKPERVEIAGNPRNENERWLYRMGQGSKYIYFEGGEVHGWE